MSLRGTPLECFSSISYAFSGWIWLLHSPLAALELPTLCKDVVGWKQVRACLQRIMYAPGEKRSTQRHAGETNNFSNRPLLLALHLFLDLEFDNWLRCLVFPLDKQKLLEILPSTGDMVKLQVVFFTSHPSHLVEGVHLYKLTRKHAWLDKLRMCFSCFFPNLIFKDF